MADLSHSLTDLVAAIFPPAALPDMAISALARAVKIDEAALIARRSEVLELTRQYVSYERSAKDKWSPGWDDDNVLRTRHRKIADAFSKSAEHMAKLSELMEREAEGEYPLAEGLQFKCGLRAKELEEFARKAASLFVATADTIRQQTPSRSKRRAENPKPRGRRPQSALRAFAIAMFYLCDDEGAVATGGGNPKGPRRFALGLSAFLDLVPEAPKATGQAIEELLRKAKVRSRRARCSVVQRP